MQGHREAGVGRSGEGRPADGDDHRIGERFPAVVCPCSPDKVIALAFQGHAACGEVNPETAADEEGQCRPLVAGGPSGAFVAGRVYTPLDLDVLACPEVFGRVDEVPEDPAARLAPVLRSVSLVPVTAHRRRLNTERP